MEVQRARIAAIAGLCGAKVEQDKAYPGWAPNPSSPVLQVCLSIRKDLPKTPVRLRASQL